MTYYDARKAELTMSIAETVYDLQVFDDNATAQAKVDKAVAFIDGNELIMKGLERFKV